MTRRVLGFALAVFLAAVSVRGQDTSRTEAASMEKKLAAIVQRGETPEVKRPTPLRTGFTDREVNAYFKINGKEFLPEGLLDPEITIDEGGKVQAKAIVDLDAALQPKKRSVFDPLAWLSGKTQVTAAGVVRASDGQGVLQLQSATLAGVTIPKSLLQQLVSYYTKTPESPQGFDIDKPFVLPSNIKAVEISRGQATVVQP